MDAVVMTVIARINNKRSPLLYGTEAYCRRRQEFVRDRPTVYADEQVAVAEIEQRGLIDVSLCTDELMEICCPDEDRANWDDLSA